MESCGVLWSLVEPCGFSVCGAVWSCVELCGACLELCGALFEPCRTLCAQNQTICDTRVGIMCCEAFCCSGKLCIIKITAVLEAVASSLMSFIVCIVAKASPFTNAAVLCSVVKYYKPFCDSVSAGRVPS